jgi:hypothetical protein
VRLPRAGLRLPQQRHIAEHAHEELVVHAAKALSSAM